MPRRLMVVMALMCGAGCVAHPVGPARAFRAYEGKAVTTAEAALSAVETGRLVADAAAHDRVFGPFAGTAISEAEEAATSVQGTFDSIQPPTGGGDGLRSEIDDVLSEVVAHLGELRIAARRGESRGLAEVAGPLRGDAERLRAFIAARQ